MKKIILFFLFFIGNLSHAMKLSDVNSELPTGFEQNMPQYYCECTSYISTQKFSEAADILMKNQREYPERFRSRFFNNQFLKETLVKELQSFYIEINSAYENGFYDTKNTAIEFITAILLGNFYFEFNVLIENVASLIPIMINAKTCRGDSIFFEKSSGRLVLKSSFSNESDKQQE